MSIKTSIATHNGNFHCDDIVAYLILSESIGPVRLTRTRNPKEIEEATVVFDVGGTYNDDRYRYDHHFDDDRLIRESGIKYSSAGLIWKHYGTMFLEEKYSHCGFSEEEIDRLWKAIDERIFEWIDRIDNGQLEEGRLPKNCITINGMINSFVPTWDTEESFDEAFHKAAEWTSIWLSNEIKKIVGQIKAESLVMDDFENRPFDRVLVMDEFKPWQKAIFENGIAYQLDYVAFYDKNNDEWRIQCVPPEDGSFEKKRPLPKEWAGLRDKELSNLLGIEMIFCHPGRFIAGFKSKDDLPVLVDWIYS